VVDSIEYIVSLDHVENYKIVVLLNEVTTILTMN